MAGLSESRFCGYFLKLKLLELLDKFVCPVAVYFNLERLGQIQAENSHNGFRIDLIFVSGKVNREIIAVCHGDKFLYRFNA